MGCIMKNFYSRFIALLLAIVINMFIPFAGSVSAVADEIDKSKFGEYDPNILTASRLSLGFDGSGGGIVDQYWYTKLIKLDGYNQKDVSGTLHYEIVPDYSIDNAKPIEYQVTGTYPSSKVNVTIRSGRIRKYTYDVPFSSSDFVDSKFNELCANASSDFGQNHKRSWSNPPIDFGHAHAKNYVDLFNHAFLHEWGTIIAEDDPDNYDDMDLKIYRVGKVSQTHFSTIQNYLKYVKQMRDNNLWINWKNDHEAYVAGYRSDWKRSNSLDGEENIYRRLRSTGANEELLVDASKNEEHLSAYPSFKNGTMEFTKFHTIPEYFKNGPYTDKRIDKLYAITRPIAINKKYDSNGNITLLEKPLFPSASMPKFIAENTYYYNQDYKDDHSYRLDIYRYILREKQPTGIPLKCGYEPYVLDVVYSNNYLGEGKIYIYKLGEESKYKNYFRTSPDIRSTVEYGPFCNEVSERIQVVNTYGEPNPEPDPTPTPVPTESTEPGNGGKDLLSWKIDFGPGGGGLGIIDQVWYTKFIDMRGYKGRDISGTLHFELVPDTTANEEYTVKSSNYNENFPDDPSNYTKVKVVPGIMSFKYDTPFSSDDFVDEEFNRLVTEARSDFTYSWQNGQKKTADDVRAEHMIRLFDHAFLHEWGTVLSSQNEVYRVGKVLPSHFDNQNEYKEYCNNMENSHQWVNWKDDPEKHVTGYKVYPSGAVDLELEAKADRPLIRDDETMTMHLATISSFINGDMSFTSQFINRYDNLNYRLHVLTRPIAISKTYDAAGNITSIEKPLFPSVPLLDFYAKHNAKLFPEDFYENGGYIKDIDDCDYIFRYKLIERDATGVDVTPTDEEVIVEVAYQRGYWYHEPAIRMYQNEKKAKENRYTYRVKPGDIKPMANETTERVRLANRVNLKDYPQTGDNNHVWLYLALIGVALTTTLLIIRKRKTN